MLPHNSKYCCSTPGLLGAGPAAPPLVEVPKRARTESSAASRADCADAARYLLDTDMVSASRLAPALAQHLQQAAGCDGASPHANGGSLDLEGVRQQVLRQLHGSSVQSQAGAAPAADARMTAGVTAHPAQPADEQDCPKMYGDNAPGKAVQEEGTACIQEQQEDLQLDTPIKLPDTPSAASRELSGSAKLS